jgi:hypothetical protein
MAKLKLDVKKIKETLASRVEILGIVVAVALVVVCFIWGITNLLGASSPESAILASADELTKHRNRADSAIPKPPARGSEWDWRPVKLANNPELNLNPYFTPGLAGSSLRVNPVILGVENQAIQIDVLQHGVHTYAVAADHVTGFKDPGADKEKVHPIVLVEAKKLVVVSASFPYNAQAEVYQKALRLDQVGQVFSKGFAPTFEGLNVERRKINSQGVAGPWEAIYDFNAETGELIKISEPIVKLLKTALYDTQWVDTYWDAIAGACATPLPLLTNGETYPPIEKNKLPDIVNRPKPRFGKKDIKSKNIIAGGGYAHLPYGKERPSWMLSPSFDKAHQPMSSKFDELEPDLQDQFTGKINWFSPFGNDPDKLPDPSKNFSEKFNITPDVNTNNRAPPEQPTGAKALVRFIDVDMEPGIYQYRIKVRMANPNYGQPPEVLQHSGLAGPKELHSDWVETQPFLVPVNDFQFYITNQERGFVSKVRGVDTKMTDKMVPFQVQRFVDKLEQGGKGGTQEYFVADWVIAERLLVARGEPIGHKAEVEVAVWKHLNSMWEVNGFHFAKKTFDPAKERLPQAKPLLVDFRPEPPVLLLDFTGGKHKYKGVGKDFEDDSGIEALVLMPDMTMTLRKAREDANDETALEHYGEWKTRLEKLQEPPPPPTPLKK